MENIYIRYSPKEWAKLTKENLKKEISLMSEKPSLTIVNANETPASLSYVKGKIKDCEDVGIKVQYIGEEKISSLTELRSALLLSNSSGIIVQEPTPFDKNAYTKLIDSLRDVDGAKRQSYFTPATPLGIIRWLEGNEVNLEGEDVCIIGRSDLVGKPLAKLMTDKNATVTLCHSKTKNLEEKIRAADVVVAAIGNPEVINENWLNDGRKRLVIDVGINRVNGKLVGDIGNYNLVDGYCTPVPGGVGLLTRVALLENVVKAHKLQGRHM